MSDTAQGEGVPPEPQAPLAVEVISEDSREQALAQASRAILAHPMLRQHFPASDLWMVGFDVDDKVSDDAWFLTTVHDTVTGRSVRVNGPLDDPSDLALVPSAQQWPPTEDEFAWAVSVLEENDRHRALLVGDDVTTYRPVPPLANLELPDGTVERVIAVGIRTGGPEPHHRVVGVRTSDGEVLTDVVGVPAGASADCGMPPGDRCPPATGASQARVRVRRGDELLWDLVVVRPQASSGINGSGVELRNVDYKSQRVLYRAHLPIVNLRYGPEGAEARCGPAFRAWQHEESCFRAAGDDPVPGFRLCPSPAETALDSGADDGDFRGVALWLDGDELVIVSQLGAGWHRYVSEWRLHAEGTIRPRFGATAVRNPCTCLPHDHHAYWRFDFDVLGAEGNVVQEFNDPPVLGTANWHTVHYEVRRNRDPAHGRLWRVRNVRASQGYAIVPGEGDGVADDYGAGDVWVLRHHTDEADDDQGFTTEPLLSRAQLDRYVTAESVERQDIVIWYGAHLFHHQAAGGDGPVRRVGPDLVPYQWKDAPAEKTPFTPLQPPGEDEVAPPSAPPQQENPSASP
ncbi:MAG TPA: hypothetical protein VHH09_05360 [Acidimicrobiales bacterium]|nr:hypothetical protein [Acidimicrobiales bacterium]